MNSLPTPALVRTTIWLCALTAFCEGIDLQAAGVAAAGIGDEMTPAPDKLADFFTASTLGLLIGAIVGGRLADTVGRKAVLVSSVALFGLFSILTAAAENIQALAAMRLATGLGLGGALPMMLAYVSESAAAGRAHSSVTLVYAATPLGGAAASLISLGLGVTHWRVIFVIGGLLPLALSLLMLVCLRESVAYDEASRTGKRGSFSDIFAEGRRLNTVLLWVSFFLALLLLYLLLNWLPTMMISNGMTRSQAAAAQIGFNIGGAIASVVFGRLIEGRLRNASVLVVYIAVPVLLVLLAKAPTVLAVSVTIVFCLGCAVIAAQAFLYAMAPGAYPILIRGLGVGMAVAMGRIGSIVGPKLGGFFKQAGHSPSQLFMDLLPLVIVGSAAALALAWVTRRPRTASHS